MTPIVEKVRHDLDSRYALIERDKLTRFLMARSSSRDLEIIDCRGKRISAGLGCVFEGQLREIFWSFIKPCIEDAIQASCDAIEQVLPGYSRADRVATLETGQAALRGFAARIYHRMVDLDRRMRGKGYPESVQPYDPAREIRSANELIAHKLAILRRHHLPPLPQELWNKHQTLIISTVIGILAFIAGRLWR